MTDEELLGLFQSARRSAFRLETLQYYAVADEADAARRREFAAGRQLPARASKSESMRLVREAVASGTRVHRVHVVDLPPSDYIRYELAVYPENIAAGEQVRLVDRAAHPGLADLATDFWLFDDSAVVWLRHSAEGDLVGCDLGEDPADVRHCRDQRDLALEHSLSLDEFTSAIAAH